MPQSTSRQASAAQRLRAIAARQSGVVSRRQALEAGMSTSAVGRSVATGWGTVHPGAYFIDSGKPSAMARAWAALLYSQGSRDASDPSTPTSVLGGATALWCAGVLDDCPAVIDLDVSGDRRVQRQPGLRVRLRSELRWHPSRQPWQAPLEHALLDATDRAVRPEQVVDLVLAAGQRRLTSAARVLAAEQERTRLRWRRLVVDLCADLVAGVQSPLERRYRLRVERAHGLPEGARNRAEALADGGFWYRDVRYQRWRVVVELDGRSAHPVDLAFRDRRRDNRAARRHESVLRYGWREVAGTPCELAMEVAAVLAGSGWRGALRPCGAGCPVADPLGEGFIPLGGQESSA